MKHRQLEMLYAISLIICNQVYYDVAQHHYDALSTCSIGAAHTFCGANIMIFPIL